MQSNDGRGLQSSRSAWRYLRWVVLPMLGLLGVGASLWGAKLLGERVSDALDTDTVAVAGGRPVTVLIPPGSSARQIGEILTDAGVVDSVSDFERAVRNRRVAADLKAGLYELQTGMGIEAAVDVVVLGPGGGDVYRLTVIEGKTIDEVVESLALQTPFTAEELSTPLLDGTVASPLLPGPARSLSDWEGLLFPDTYEFNRDDPPQAIVERLSDTMMERVGSIDWSRIEGLGVSQYEAIIIASLIEAEARLDDDRPLISSVVYNRLENGQALQVDATVLYALGEHRSVLTFDDLEVDSPYNTYLRPGLPPTPIAAPRLASLQAAADPAETDFLYYVLVDAGGAHGFTASYDEFLAWKDQAKEDGIIP